MPNNKTSIDMYAALLRVTYTYFNIAPRQLNVVKYKNNKQ